MTVAYYQYGPVAGIPVVFADDDNGFYITATYQYVQIDGSPLVLHFYPPVPVAEVSRISLPELLLFLITALGAGAIITFP